MRRNSWTLTHLPNTQFVYEPHIAPKVETWAESFLENRRQKKRQRQGPVLADPHPLEQGDENSLRRLFSDPRDKKNDDDCSMSIELEQLAAQEREAWRQGAGSSSGLRQRNAASAMDESNVSIPYPAMTPTHVIFDTSEPPSPGGRSSIRSTPLSSKNSSPSQPRAVIPGPRSVVVKLPSPPPRNISPRLPTPMSNYTPASSRAISPATLLERSSTDVFAPQASTSAYNTPVGGSIISQRSTSRGDIHSFPSSRGQSPFSEIHSVDARDSPEHIHARSPVASPRVQSPSIGSDLTMESDDEFDILSPRSGMFSPSNRVHVFLRDDVSQHGSDVSWASVGRRSPEF
ncbi:hypothetical protein BN946_scf184794.g15 [Trametes cinnabarina]|uniref:Uncharacterized protein n=1 Tax=Pycnoporus cinnabarinus TaxID=5643 RepID=A0A060SRX4_PYCCI|nr:hypothetical protein BN946_scf184794.g15 [Trametes cinnabarina]